MFRFLHAADIHLDSPLRGLSRYDGAPVERFRTATREALGNLIDAAIDRQVAFLIIAGDLYDGDWRDYNTGIFFIHAMGRLRDAGIPVYLLRGNHDAESQITSSLTLPDNVFLFSTRKAQTFRRDDIGVALHGRGYPHRDVTENLVPDYPEPLPGLINIGVLHTCLEGDAAHAPYAPCSVPELSAKGYDYWALGHVHVAKHLHRDPFIVFPGNLQGRNIRETGAKGAVLVTCDDGRVAGAEPIALDVVRWARVTADVSGASSVTEVLEAARDEIERAASEADGRTLALRVRLEGRAPVHAQLLSGEDQLKAEVRAIAAGLGQDVAWVEKIEIRTASERDPERERERADAMGELRRMLADSPADATLAEGIHENLKTLFAKLPSELRADVRERSVEDVIRDAVAYLTDRLESPRS